MTEHVSGEVTAQRAVELLVTLAKERFTGTLELHFLEGMPKSAKKTTSLHLDQPQGVACQQG